MHIFFDLMDVACANSRIIYNMIDPNDLSLRNFKVIDSTYLIETYTSQNSAQPDARTGSKKSVSISLSKVTYHHIFQSLKKFGDDVNIATKKELTKKITLNHIM